MTLEQATAAFRADCDRKSATLLDGTKAAALDQVLTGAELLAKHLSAAPAGTTIGDLIATQKMRSATT